MFGQMPAGPVKQRGNGAASDAHHPCRLFLFIAEAVDQTHRLSFALREKNDCGRDVDRDRRVDWYEGPLRHVRLMALLVPEVFERTASRDPAEPRTDF